MVGESATDACYGKEKDYQCAEDALQTVVASILRIGCTVEHQQGYKEHNANEYQVPVIEEFGEEYVAKVAFVGKFGEEGTGGATTSVARVDGVE